MFKKYRAFVIVLILPLLVFSQQTDKINFEAGSVINSYFPKEKISAAGSQPFNYYLRIEYGGHTWTRNKWSLYIPMGISYSYYAIDYSSGSKSFNQAPGNVYHNFLLFAGPQLQYQNRYYRLNGALFLNNKYISTRIFGMIHLKERLWIGPSLEMFFYDINYSYQELMNRRNVPNYEKRNFFGLNGDAIRFNAGIKLQMDLKY